MSRIDYDLTQINGIVFDVDGVLSPSTVPMGNDGRPVRMANLKDGYALQLAVKKGLKIAIITGADTPAIIERYNMLGIKDVYIKASQKLPILQKWMTDNNLSKDLVAYVGDDIPDIECLLNVGLPVSPADAAPEVKEIAVYVSPVTGGYGVARDLIEMVMKAKGLWMTTADAFGW
ncbi:MAG: HAD hydrolase family protein [Muribaculaceae bacterium]|nr:HAD hydrolase family protein [Muribaculaceae bacterium]